MKVYNKKNMVDFKLVDLAIPQDQKSFITKGVDNGISISKEYINNMEVQCKSTSCCYFSTCTSSTNTNGFPTAPSTNIPNGSVYIHPMCLQRETPIIVIQHSNHVKESAVLELLHSIPSITNITMTHYCIMEMSIQLIDRLEVVSVIKPSPYPFISYSAHPCTPLSILPNNNQSTGASTTTADWTSECIDRSKKHFDSSWSKLTERSLYNRGNILIMSNSISCVKKLVVKKNSKDKHLLTNIMNKESVSIQGQVLQGTGNNKNNRERRIANTTTTTTTNNNNTPNSNPNSNAITSSSSIRRVNRDPIMEPALSYNSYNGNTDYTITRKKNKPVGSCDHGSNSNTDTTSATAATAATSTDIKSNMNVQDISIEELLLLIQEEQQREASASGSCTQGAYKDNELESTAELTI